MTNPPKPIKTIHKEDAVFRLDKNGKWRQLDDEPFANRKIIKYFHSMIQKDEEGFFLQQEHEHFIEKVYFSYEETPLFVFGVIKEDGLILRLNTGEQIRLDPKNLFLKNDTLYVRNDADLIKFTENAMLSLAGYLDEEADRFVIDLDGKRYPIPVMS